jgi:alkaline phosphatase
MGSFLTNRFNAKKLSILLMTAVMFAFVTSCSDDDDSVDSNNPTNYKTPKYVFLFIGDGVGSPQINVTEAALSDDDFKKPQTQKVGLGSMQLRKFPITGMATTYAEDRYITGSAAAATALACGEKTTINTIAMTGNHGSNIKTMAEMASEKGMKVGIVSSVSIDHATPACFYAHEEHRGNYNHIAYQMSTSGFDYFGGGTAKGDFQKYRDRADDPKDVHAEMQNAGYTICTNRAELNAVQPGTKCWAYTDYDGSGAMIYEMDRTQDQISLAEFTQKGIELLDNDKGFFMMVEAGKVDWACHANDVVAAAHNMVAFDEAIAKAIEFYNQHPDETLIVVTGDHECGGLTLGFAATHYESAFDILKYQNVSYEVFASKVYSWAENGNVTFQMALDSLKHYFGLGNANLHANLAISDYEMNLLEDAYDESMGSPNRDDEEIFLKYGPYYDPLTVTATHILNQKAGIDWTSYYHTGVPVPVLAMGQGEIEFTGYYDNTDVAKKIINIAEFNK